MSNLNWQTAPYMVAEVELDRDNTLSIYCERDQIDKVPAALLRVISLPPAALQDDDERKEAGLKIIGDQAAEIVRLRSNIKDCDEQLSSVLHEFSSAASMCWNQKPTGEFFIDQAMDAMEHCKNAILELRGILRRGDVS